MQEEDGGVATVDAPEPPESGGAEPPAGAAGPESAAPAPGGEPQEPSPAGRSKKKRVARRKKPDVPTVADVVAAETGAVPGDAAAPAGGGAPSDGPAPEDSPHGTEGGASDVPAQKAVPAEDGGAAADVQGGDAPPGGAGDDVPEEDVLAVRRANLNLDSETALVETVLFLESEPQTAEALSKITQLSLDVVGECIGRLKEKYANADSGIEVSQIVGGWLLTPKKECFDLVKERYGRKNEGRLSKAAIETLSIIAYSQPITRAEIKSYRGVDPDNMLHVLLDRKFIREVGTKDVPGRPTLYGTTKEFLEFFHLQSLAELPQPDEQEERERFELAR